MEKVNKRKNKVRVFILILCIIVIAMTFFFYQKTEADKKKKEIAGKKEILKKVNNINNTYSLFIDGKKIDKDDNLASFFNNTIEIHNKLSNLSTDALTIKHLQNVDKTIGNLNMQKDGIKTLLFEDINKYLDNYIKEEKDAINKIYSESIITKEKENDLENKEKVISLIDKKLIFLNFLKENKENYYLNGNTIMGKNSEFVTKAKSYKTNFLIENEEGLGKKIPVLMYHAVDDNTWGDSGLFVKTSEFEKQMKYLYDNGYTTLFISEIQDAPKYEKPVIITFDDGYLNVYKNAFPIMKKYKIKSTFYIITKWMDGDTFVTSDIVKTMDESGIVEIGSHSLTHMKLGANTKEAQEKEMKESKEDLEKILNKKINAIAYPFGSYNIDTINLTKEYYSNGVTVESGFNFSKTLYKYKIKRQKINRGENMNSFIFKIGG